MTITVELCDDVISRLRSCNDRVKAIHPEMVTPVLFDQFKRAFVKANDAHILNLDKLKEACKQIQTLTATLDSLAGIDV